MVSPKHPRVQAEEPCAHTTEINYSQGGYAPSLFFFLHIGPVLSGSKALGLTARSLHQCCRAQCSHAMNCMPRGENMDLLLQVTLVHGSAVGTVTPKQPKINLLHT